MQKMGLIKHNVRRVLREPRLLFRKLLSPPRLFEDRYHRVDNSRVTLFTDNPSLFSGYEPRKPLKQSPPLVRVQVTLIASVKDEVRNVDRWVEGVLGQTRLPDEIIVVDAGSTDGTIELLQRHASESSVPFQVFVEPGANIARARNLAVTRARYPVIACNDFGGQLRSDWLQNIVAPFEVQPDIEVAAGVFIPVDRRGQPVRNHPQWRIERIKPQRFLPSSRSIAFSKNAWAAVGGYPEWLTLTGEDTYFDLELKRNGGQWAFVPEAIVEWFAPDTFSSYCQKEYRWSIGDGESGVFGRTYWYFLCALGIIGFSILAVVLLSAMVLLLPVKPEWLWIGLLLLAELAGLFAITRAVGLELAALHELPAVAFMVAGFVEGARRQNQVNRRRLSPVHGTIFILSGVPIDDTGGGARCTQIALELLRQGFAVVFISRFPKYESRELNLGIVHPNLFNFALSKFKWEEFVQTYASLIEDKPLSALVEFPLADFLPLLEKVLVHGGIAVYDLLDEWNTALGSRWYSEAIESEIIQKSRALVATAPSLVARLERMSRRTVTCIPNAVNQHLFDPCRNYARPPDMPLCQWTAIYTGALWGEWFDWDLLVQLAKQCPEAAIVVVGDYHGQCPAVLPNLHFLGLKAQKELPAYLAHADVAIIPWKINDITRATSPLKIYEYLAMHRPVVAPNITPLQGLPGVCLFEDAAGFLEQVTHGRQTAFPVSEFDQFVRENNWQVRVKSLLETIEQARA